MKLDHAKAANMLKMVAIAAFLVAMLPLSVASALAETYTKSFTYDLNGNIETRTTPDNATISYAYDGVNRLTDITYPDGKTVSFTYDGNGNRLRMADPTGTTWYAYDRFNRLAAVQPPGLVPIYYDYDKSGNLTKLTYPDATAVTYEYDSSNRLWKVTDPTGTTTYEYDNNSNNLVKKTLSNGVYTTYAYDPAKRITDVINKKSDGSVISSHHYAFDANGNRTQAVETAPAGATTTDYAYDKLDRLTSVTCSDGAFETYTYDGSGNRKTKATPNGTLTYDYDGDNRLIKIGSANGNTALFYDRSGNLTKKISANKTISYGYDDENRLVSYADGVNTVTFAYDGDGNRISKTVNGTTTRYINDTSSPISQVLLETNSQSQVTARYTYGDSRLSQMNGGGISYYLYDNPGRSVVAVVNGSQTVLNGYAYNSFGDLKASTETAVNDFLYTGEQYDDETGLIYLRKRYYDPETGRLLSKDPFPGFVTQPQTVNPYPYVTNNPANFTDPLGLWTVSVGVNIGAMFGAVGGGGGTAINIGYSAGEGLSASITGTVGGGAVTGIAVGVGVTFAATNASSVKQLLGTSVEASRGLGPVAASGIAGNGYTGGAMTIGVGGVTVSPSMGAGIVTNTSAIAQWGQNSGFSFLEDGSGCK